jgi:hypothetical protein
MFSLSLVDSTVPLGMEAVGNIGLFDGELPGSEDVGMLLTQPEKTMLPIHMKRSTNHKLKEAILF